MKRKTKSLLLTLGVFALMVLFVPPAHALRTVLATIAFGEVQVIGIQAKKSANISWEGVVVTKSNKLGAFQFSTTNLPADCVGQLADGLTTIAVVINDCTPAPVTIFDGGALKTGQTTIIAPGDDGEFQRGIARSFTNNNDGTITDNVTGLVWEELTNDGSIHSVSNRHTWVEAFQKIAALNAANFAGHNDWRLPNINELQTLANYGVVNPATYPAFNDGINSFTQFDIYWSSTTYPVNTNFGWMVYFHRGYVDAYDKTRPNYVRAVRGGP